MAKRKIIKIDEEKCNGCSLCIPNCPEGALQMIDGKARLISDLFCDGLGACIGHCPEGAITIEEREAEGYDEKKVMENIVKQGKNVIKAHLEHLKCHNEETLFQQAVDFLKERNIEVPDISVPDEKVHQRAEYVQSSTGKHDLHAFSGCPGSRVIDFSKKEKSAREDKGLGALSQLRQWPIQIMLVPPHAPYLKDADLLIAADCVPFAYAGFHSDLLKNKVLLIGCPKLDDAEFYKNKITQIFKNNNIKSATCAHMEVPCCFGLVSIVKSAISESGKDIPFKEVNIGIKGEKLS